MSGDVVLLTGCSSGFGLHASVYLAKKGLRVVATMRNLGKRARLDRAAAEAGAALEVETLDVTDAASVERCVGAVLARHGRIDGVVNNAGYGVGGSVLDLGMDELRALMETNFFGVVALTKAVLPGMVERRRGRVVNVSSIGGHLAMPFISGYHASKFAVEGWSESLRHELLPFGVHVCLVEPGAFRTEIFEANRRMAARAGEGSVYAETYRRGEDLVARAVRLMPTDPTPVSRAIHAALTQRRPRLRRFVGIDAYAQRLAKSWLPFRLIEALVGTQVR